jgi:SAM-dependent methyltransferase
MPIPSPTEFGTQVPPRPPDLLIDRVTPGLTAAHAEVDRVEFDKSGVQSVKDIQSLLSLIGRSLDSYETILDFGCGCGRIARWMQPLLGAAEIHGCDIDEQAIRWAQANLTFATFQVNQPLPPLPYEDATFDLIFNHSVFTHLDTHYQDLWLEELRRVLRPGGTALLTVHGEWAYQVEEDKAGSLAEVWRGQLEREGILFVSEDSYVGGSHPDFYHTTFHTPWYVFSHWTRWLEIVAYVPRGSLDHQDAVVLRRPAFQTSTRPIVPRASGLRPPDVVHGPTILAKLRAHLAKLRAHLATPAPAPAVIEQRLSPLIVDIFNRQGERLSRLEREVELLARHGSGTPSGPQEAERT